jgi:hypothetical protein
MLVKIVGGGVVGVLLKSAQNPVRSAVGCPVCGVCRLFIYPKGPTLAWALHPIAV